MKKQKSIVKNTIFIVTAFVMMILSISGLFVMSNKSATVLAANDNMIPVAISNSNFTSKTSSDDQPSNFSAYNRNGKISDISSSTVNAKVINTDSTSYKSKFKNLSRGNNHDKYVLMIDNEDPNHNSYLGYRTDSAISLDISSYYMITVDVYTTNTTGNADLFLFKNDTVFSSLENLNSFNTWTTYHFFVSTNESSSLNLNLGMYLDGSGSVLFDNISAFKISDSQLKSNLEMLDTKAYTYEDDRTASVIDEYTIRNNNLKLYNAKTSTYHPFTKVYFDSSVLDGNCTVDDETLILTNENETYAQYATENLFKFNKLETYKISVYMNTKLTSGNAYLRLVDSKTKEQDYKTNDSSSNTIKISSSSSNNVVDKYSFYISGHSFDNTEYKLIFGLGNETTKAKGSISIKQIVVSKINHSSYSSAASTNATKIDLTQHPKSKFILSNGDFNAVEIEDYSKPFPAKPSSWSFETLNDNQVVGVINTEETSFNAVKSSTGLSLDNPDTNENNNVLLLHNKVKGTISITSAAKTLTAETLHKFTLNAKTYESAKLTISLATKINDSEFILVSKNINKDTTFWENNNIEFFLKNGYQSLDVYLKITMETDSLGYAYIDDAMMDFLIAPTQEDFDSAKNAKKATVDLSNMFLSTSNNQWSTPTLFTTPENDNVKTGIVNAQELGTITTENLTNYYVLGIKSNQDGFYTTSSKLGFSLEAEQYYKISLKVLTNNIASNDDNIEDKNLGASVKISNFEEQFTAINSNNKWVEYSFYVKPNTTANSYLELSLGSAVANSIGEAYFADINFEKIEEAEYTTNAVDSDFVKVLKPVVENEEEDTETPAETPASNNNTNIWFLIAGIATPLAVIIAVVAILLRKIKWKKPRKKTKNEYDRKQTVSKQVLSRKATMMREDKLRELNKDLEKMSNERAKFEETYKADIKQLRELKIKRASAAEISKLEKEIKKNQKLAASIGVTVVHIENEIEYVKTDSYLNSLMKKISKAAITDKDNEPNN